ncbi:MAG: hypothetical protein Q8920_01865 [Bacillota bacterium]|nr:hypothetical protein [Bacillota bacterium]
MKNGGGIMRYEYDKEKNLFIYEKNEKRLLATNVLEDFYFSREIGILIYHKFDTECYLKRISSNPLLLGKNVQVVYLSADTSTIVFIRNMKLSGEYRRDFRERTGDLCVAKDGYIKIIDEHVNYAYIQKGNGDIKVFYTKAIPEKMLAFFYNNLNVYTLNEDKSKEIIKRIDGISITLIKNPNDTISFICYTPYKNTIVDGDLYYVSNERPILIDKFTKSEYKYNKKSNSIMYIKNELEDENEELSLINYSLDIGEKTVCRKSVDSRFWQDTRVNLTNQEVDASFLLPKHLQPKEREAEAVNDITLNEFKFYFTKIPSKRYYIACELAKCALKHEIIKNECPLDDTENHQVVYSKEQMMDLELMLYNFKPIGFLREVLYGIRIYGIDIKYLIKYCDTLHSEHFKEFFNIDFRRYIEDVLDKLMAHHGFVFKSQLKDYLIGIQKKMLDRCMYCFNAIGQWSDEDALKNTLKKIEEKLVLEKVIPSKWKSESAMFELIKKNFPEATMQYSPNWLRPQRIDVFAPEINCAFEYQGLQHFEPTKYFGGEEDFNKRVELDNRKKKLCTENGINLIEWFFNEPITIQNLRNKLKQLNIVV